MVDDNQPRDLSDSEIAWPQTRKEFATQLTAILERLHGLSIHCPHLMPADLAMMVAYMSGKILETLQRMERSDASRV